MKMKKLTLQDREFWHYKPLYPIFRGQILVRGSLIYQNLIYNDFTSKIDCRTLLRGRLQHSPGLLSGNPLTILFTAP